MEKYLIASSEDTLESKVSGRFGHSVYYLVVDPQSMEYEFFQGVERYEDQNIAKFIKSDVKKVILGNIGPSAFKEVRSYGCKIYLCRNMPVPEAIKKVREGEMSELNEPTIKESIHSARKTGNKYGGHGETNKSGGETGFSPGHGQGRGYGRGFGKGRKKSVKGSKRW